MAVMDKVIADVGDKDIQSFRMNLSRFAEQSGKRFKTKKDKSTGHIWVGRIE